jgi:hypothetical protein
MIVESALALEPRSVLDLGMGTGKYGFLIRDQSDFAHGTRTVRIVGVEGYSDYVGDHQRAVYDEIVVGDVNAYLSTTSERFDVALALDIIEHFEPAEAVDFVRKALDVSRFVFVSSPRVYYPQDDHENVLEWHRSWWPRPALRTLARCLDAKIAERRDWASIVVVLSRGEQPRLASYRAAAIRSWLTTNLLPEILYSRARGRSGPMLRPRDLQGPGRERDRFRHRARLLKR